MTDERDWRGLGTIRIVVGLLLFYHGLEVFDREVMQGYLEWQVFENRAAGVMPYVGKSLQLLAGGLLAVGWQTRLAGFLVVVVMSGITFWVGNGKFWYQDQHPFLFALFGALYAFTGPGAWSIEGEIRRKRGAGGY